MNPEAYREFAHQLQANLEADPRVIGLVFAGSAAHQSHAPDEWSDHDFFVVTVDGVQESFRTSYEWLPDHESIVLSVRETEHGLKILYASGHMLEFAIFNLDEVARAKLNDFSVAFDRGGVRQAAEQIASATPPPLQTADDSLRNIGMVLCLLLVGAGRVARGEAISGQMFIRSHALHHLLPLLAQILPAEDKSALDNLDPFRRFERVFPEVGAQVNAALNRDPLGAAMGMLDVLERYLGDMDGFPSAAAATVRNFLNRTIQQISD
ncbi:MAG: hypothetical protein U0452_01475 [Anaerolineae bacterium]